MQTDMPARRNNTAAERKLRTTVRARGDECGICGQPIDYDLPPGQPGSFEIDHVQPVSMGGKHVLSNVRASHRACNRARGNHWAEPAPAATPAAVAATPCPASECAPCRGIHDPRPGVTFVTSRQW